MLELTDHLKGAIDGSYTALLVRQASAEITNVLHGAPNG